MTSIETVQISKAEWLASKPAWAKAAIVAELEHDESDSMSDYFATRTFRRVFLAWSAHARDLFSETRKAAATFAETAHLGPGKDIYRAQVVAAEDIVSNGSAYWKGTASPWHRELYDAGYDGATFSTRAEVEAFIAVKGAPEPISFEGHVKTFEWRITRESVEHREKYSMGHGYYLKASGRYSSGWIVRKTSWLEGFSSESVETLAPASTAPSAEARI